MLCICPSAFGGEPTIANAELTTVLECKLSPDGKHYARILIGEPYHSDDPSYKWYIGTRPVYVETPSGREKLFAQSEMWRQQQGLSANHAEGGPVALDYYDAVLLRLDDACFLKKGYALPDTKPTGQWVAEHKKQETSEYIEMAIYDLDNRKLEHYKQYDANLPFKKTMVRELFHFPTSANAVAFHIGPEGYADTYRALIKVTDNFVLMVIPDEVLKELNLAPQEIPDAIMLRRLNK